MPRMISLLVAFLASSAAKANAFSTTEPMHLRSFRLATPEVGLVRRRLSERGDNKNEGNDNDDGPSQPDKNNDDSMFLESFRQAANSKLGSPIPSNDFVAETASQAENDFAKAMQAAKREFAQAKEKAGGDVDGAVDLVLGKLQEEEGLVESLEREMKSEEELDIKDGIEDQYFQ